MNIIQFDSHIIIEMNKKSNLHSLLTFINGHTLTPPNLIINFLKSLISQDLIVSKLLPFHLNWEKQNKSFILVSNISKNQAKGIICIKTLEEALDFFYMEQLTKNI